MAFTDRFVKVPIKIYDRKQAELMDKTEYEDSFLNINPFEISHYKPTTDKDNDDQECVYVTMKQGDGFFVYLTIPEFEKLLNDSQK
jgi:hypothetical protein